MKACHTRPVPCHTRPAACHTRPVPCHTRPVASGFSSSYQFPSGTDKKAALEGGPSYQQIKSRISPASAHPNRRSGARGPLRPARGSLPMGPAGFGVPPMGLKQ